MTFALAGVVLPVLPAGAPAGADQRAVQQHHPATVPGDLLQGPVQAWGARAASRPTTSRTRRVTVVRCPVTVGQVTRPLVTAQYRQYDGGDLPGGQGPLPPRRLCSQPQSASLAIFARNGSSLPRAATFRPSSSPTPPDLHRAVRAPHDRQAGRSRRDSRRGAESAGLAVPPPAWELGRPPRPDPARPAGSGSLGHQLLPLRMDILEPLGQLLDDCVQFTPASCDPLQLLHPRTLPRLPGVPTWPRIVGAAWRPAQRNPAAGPDRHVRRSSPETPAGDQHEYPARPHTPAPVTCCTGLNGAQQRVGSRTATRPWSANSHTNTVPSGATAIP